MASPPLPTVAIVAARRSPGRRLLVKFCVVPLLYVPIAARLLACTPAATDAAPGVTAMEAIPVP